MCISHTCGRAMLLSVSALLVCAAPATTLAATSFTSIARAVSATSDGSNQSFSLTSFGLFDRIASANGATSGLAQARQTSTVDAVASTISFQGAASTAFDFPTANTGALTTLDLYFTLDAPTPYSGELLYFPGFPAATMPPQVLIRNATTDTLVVNLISTAGPMGALSGSLDPGDYHLIINIPNPNPSMTTNGGGSSVGLTFAFIPGPSALAPMLAMLVGLRRRHP